MKPTLKKLSEQVLVITGASSGIGLTTARMAARRGARLVLASRNEQALKQLVAELQAAGGEAVCVAADVGRYDDVQKIALVAVERFGGFDTWVNNAGVSVFGRLEDVAMEDHRRLFETNFWGVVHGSLTALAHLRQRGGALINVGSETSDVGIPLQGMYSASKHAVKGFTDALRVEIEGEGAPVSITLVKPASIDTLLVEHAKNYLEVEPRLPAPVYAPESVAEAILEAAQHAHRDLFVGSRARLASSAAHHAPRLVDKYLQKFVIGQQKTDLPARDRAWNGLHAPGSALRERASGVRRPSVYTKAALHPRAAAAFVLGTGLAAAALAGALRRRR